MYKLVAIDLDGTMLNQYGVITQKTKETIQKVQEKGIEVVIASGRPIDSIKTIAKETNIKNYFIAGNGSILYDIKNNQILYENLLKKSKVLDIIKICEENSIYYSIYTDKEMLAKSFGYNVLFYNKENLNKNEENKTHINIVNDIYNYILERNERVIKISICDKHQSVFNSIMRKLKEISDIEVLEVAHMSRKIIKQGTEDFCLEYFYTEISAKNVDKWNSLEILAEKMNVKKEEIVAIGDNINDKKMIENAGIGIAMKNSTPVVTNIADFITQSNDEDGVAQALETHLL